jgi:hypothetical protein
VEHHVWISQKQLGQTDALLRDRLLAQLLVMLR